MPYTIHSRTGVLHSVETPAPTSSLENRSHGHGSRLEPPPAQLSHQALPQDTSRQIARRGYPNLLSIPLELQRTIAFNLNIRDLGSLRATCRQLEHALYDPYVQTLLKIPKFTRWFATSRDDVCFKINWIEAGLFGTAFALGIEKVAGRVKILDFTARAADYKYADCCLYAYVHLESDADWSQEREKLALNTSRYFDVLESILRMTPNVHTIDFDTDASWPTTLSESTTYEGRLSEIQELDDYISEEEALYDGECIEQSLTLLMRALGTRPKFLKSMRIASNYDYRQVSTATLEYSLTHVFPGIDQTLKNLRCLELGFETFVFTYNDLKSSDTHCPNISRFFRSMNQIRALKLRSTFDGLITPKVMDSILPAIRHHTVTKLKLEFLIVRQETLAKFLRHCGKSLRALTMSGISLVNGTWEPVFTILRLQSATPTIKCYNLFELTLYGNYAVMFLIEGARLEESFETSCGHVPNSRRYQWAYEEPTKKSFYIRENSDHSAWPTLSIGAMLWAGIYYSGQHDHMLEDTKEIRSWD
ncbi:hypothetical protein IWX47DRAFT_899736 [Phyllosticta citricarpa]